MSKQVTITLSDGTPYTGTPDPDGFLLLPRGKKPAEPWWSKCEADPGGEMESPEYDTPLSPPRSCAYWKWSLADWFRIRPLPNHTWESIAPQQPAAPKRDYTNWQEGLGDSAKPEDYDQQPGKYEVQVWDSDVKAWEGYTPKQIPMWWGGLTYRVRRRQPQVPLCSTDVSWAQPRLETDAEFALRLWRTYAQFVVVDKMECVCVMPHERLVMPPADALRLARIIAEGASGWPTAMARTALGQAKTLKEAKPCHD